MIDQKVIEEGAKPEFGYGVEIGERLQAAKKDCAEVSALSS